MRVPDLLPFLRRLGTATRRDRLARELKEEIDAHIAQRTRALVDEGMHPRDAALEARRMFGNATLIHEETREMWGYRWLDTIAQDVRFGARLLRRSPMFTIAAVASLAIGVGSAAAVFSLTDRLLIRQLPVRDAGQLVLLRWIGGSEFAFGSLNGFGVQTETESSSTSFSLRAYETMKARLAPQVDLFGFADLYTVNLSADGRPESGSGQVVSGDYFSILGLAPAAGRLLTPADDAAGASPAAVIGYDFWQRRFGGDHSAIGRLINVNGVGFTIAGVLPRGFTGTLQVGQPCDVMVPLSSYQAVVREADAANPEHWWVLVMGRLKPGVTAAGVTPVADLTLKQSIAEARPQFPADKLPRVRVEPGGQGQSEERDGMREPIRTMVGVVGIVLLVACANVANLLLARGRARTREVALRAAIGASRVRIARQLLTEGLVLGLVASALGLVLAQWIARTLLPALTTSADTLAEQYALDARVVAFTCGLGVVCSVLFALIPAVSATRRALVPALQESGRGAVGGRRRFSGSGVLVAAQVGLSLVLLSGAVLLTWSARRLQAIDPGFDPSGVLTFSVDMSLNGYEPAQSRAFIGRALERLRALPGVTAATASSHRLIANSSSIDGARPEGGPDSTEKPTWRNTVDGGFFETYGIPLVSGRTFTTDGAADRPVVAVVNETLAKQLFGDVNVVGRRFVMGSGPGVRPVQIVGVAKDARYTSVRRNPPPTAYFPYQQARLGRATFSVRAAADPMTIAATVRDAMRGLDPMLPLFAVRTQEEQIRRSLAQERLFANLATLLGSITLVLAAIGLYGLLAYAVTQRTPEIGVRLALGAQRGQVSWMVLRQSLVLVGIGVALGVPGALGSGRYFESLLFGLRPTDPRAIGAAAVVLVAVGIAAAWIPARRASRIDPLVALRAE